MKHAHPVRVVVATILLGIAGCAVNKPEVSTDLSVALDVAATLEGAYAARPTADPKVVAELARLLATAQAAIVSWRSSKLPADQAAANAAISALIAYESAISAGS